MLSDLLCKNLSLDSKNIAFFIKSLKNGETFAFQENVRIPSASLIKVPIMCEVFRQVMIGNLELEQRIIVRDEDKVPYSILACLETGNSYSLRDLVTLMIIQSDNTATNILIDLAGMDNINHYISRLGLRNTLLQRKMMDFRAREAGIDNYTSAGDMAEIFENIYKKHILNDYLCDLMMEILKKQLDNSMLPLFLPEDVIVAHKTGELNGIVHDAGIIIDDNVEYILCVMNWNSEDLYKSREETGKLGSITYNYFKAGGEQ